MLQIITKNPTNLFKYIYYYLYNQVGFFVVNYKMAKNIEFKGLLNTVPYFCMWGNVWGLCGKYMGGQWGFGIDWVGMDKGMGDQGKW